VRQRDNFHGNDRGFARTNLIDLSVAVALSVEVDARVEMDIVVRYPLSS